MSAQHTPGPWFTADGHGPIEGGTSVGEPGSGYLVASCTGYWGREGARANARLIAAAPLLKEALRELMSYCELSCVIKAQDGSEIVYPAFAQARAALAAATGETVR